MTKKQFIALAETIRDANRIAANNGFDPEFSSEAIDSLAYFCARQNYAFKRDRWLSYIAGECGPNGGTIKS